jgi:hypothetical protein
VGVEPPTNGIPLFDLDDWTGEEGEAAPWRRGESYLEVVPGAGDIRTRRELDDFQLHLEFWLPSMPAAVGQARANSGVYLQDSYEVQILDSFGFEPTDDGCGAVYQLLPPLWNACRKPEVWQTLDVAFRSASREVPARITAFLNGVLIHNNAPLARTTAGARQGEGPGPIRLQDHGCPVRFRNVWVVPAGHASRPGP